MIVLDSSAVVAVLYGEPDGDLYWTAIAGADGLAISTLTAFETRTVLGGGRVTPLVTAFDTLLANMRVETHAFDAAMADAAFAAYSRYGKGVHPKARLNLCDCAAYALAKFLDAPLLFKGADFRHTDVTPAL